jgi:Brp/Blh family beta-carotene 15,15'-monooxygenase
MQLKKQDILRTLFVIISIGIIVILSPITGFSKEKVELALLGFVATFGLSHGSLDWLLAHHWGIRRTFTESMIFLACYVMIVLLTLGVWSSLPTIALIIFLVMSIYHFAHDWRDELSGNSAIILGLSTITVPGIVYQNDILNIFKLLVSDTNAVYFSQFLHYTGFLSIAASSLIAIQQFKISRFLSVEIVTLLATGLLLPPIIYFSLYFCILHSTKHWFTMNKIGLCQDLFQTLWSVLWPTIICIIVGGWFCYQENTLSFSNALIRIIFIGLAALTVPHWILLEIYPAFFKAKAK